MARAKRAEEAKIYSLKWRSENRAAYLVSECRRRAAKRGWAFDLDQHIPEIQARIDKAVCELTNFPLRLEARPGRFFDTPSIDRIEPSRGYIYSNIRVTCFAANAMLGDWGQEAALKIAQSWVSKAEKL